MLPVRHCLDRDLVFLESRFRVQGDEHRLAEVVFFQELKQGFTSPLSIFSFIFISTGTTFPSLVWMISISSFHGVFRKNIGYVIGDGPLVHIQVIAQVFIIEVKARP